MAGPRKLKPIADTHGDTALSTTDTITQYFAVTIHGEVALTPPGPPLGKAEEKALVEKTLSDEVMKARNTHTILRKDTVTLHKVVL